MTKDNEFVFGIPVIDKHDVFDKYKHNMSSGEDRTTLSNAIHDAFLAGKKSLENELVKEGVIDRMEG